MEAELAAVVLQILELVALVVDEEQMVEAEEQDIGLFILIRLDSHQELVVEAAQKDLI